jgi:amino acid permease
LKQCFHPVYSNIFITIWTVFIVFLSVATSDNVCVFLSSYISHLVLSLPNKKQNTSIHVSEYRASEASLELIYAVHSSWQWTVRWPSFTKVLLQIFYLKYKMFYLVTYVTYESSGTRNFKHLDFTLEWNDEF